MLATVLLDLGGVLTPDPWQSILLTPGAGLVDSLGLDRARVEEVGELLWPKYSLAPHPEDLYWAEFGELLGADLPPVEISRASAATIAGNPGFRPATAALDDAGVRWGFVSDNAPFWYERQLRCLGAEGTVREDMEFLSFRYGAAKTSTRPDLFELAAAQLDPGRTLVVDDRARNLDRAAAAGFTTDRYALGDDPAGSGLLALVTRHIEIR